MPHALNCNSDLESGWKLRKNCVRSLRCALVCVLTTTDENYMRRKGMGKWEGEREENREQKVGETWSFEPEYMLCISCYRLWLQNTHRHTQKWQKDPKITHLNYACIEIDKNLNCKPHRKCNVCTTICSGLLHCTPEIIFRWEIINDFRLVGKKKVVHGWKSGGKRRCKNACHCAVALVQISRIIHIPAISFDRKDKN